MSRIRLAVALPVAAVLLTAIPSVRAQSRPQQDPYEKYIKTSKDFQPVKQDKAWALKAFPSWTFMPWYHQWLPGFDDAAGKFQLDNGMNGSFTNRGGDGRIDWINKFHLRFYMDHTAGKGDLHQWDSLSANNPKDKAILDILHSNGMRPRPVNAAMKAKLQGIIRSSILDLKGSPWRGAYALDDEIGWGHFVHPSMCRITDTPNAYEDWLKEIYGEGNVPKREGWITYNDVQPKLKEWDIAHFDASQLMDQWTFNDSWWNNFLGDLVTFANSVDPATPCGYVGGQAPNAFGGFDYAKVMRKIQFTEAYNAGNSQSIIRSLNPHNGLPNVTTFFYQNVPDSVWQTWYYLANGNRGMIAWVQGWFDNKPGPAGLKATPKPWIAEVAPTWKEADDKIGPLMSGAEWIHDGVALYYSHASIQLSWIMDAEAHGKTWVNRNGDDKLGSSHLVRKAWINMLNDEGIQFNWIDYAGVVANGVPAQYKVLILPHTLCLSDAEARRIEDFCRGGGTVIADYLPGLWDQHGKGRAAGGALDDMFGVKHDPKMTAKDVFGATLWCETNQDTNFGYKTFQQLMTNGNTSIKDASGFDKAVRKMGVDHVSKYGKGKAVLMNLSPQWYNAYRQAGFEPSRQREVFMKHVKAAGARPWVRIKGATAQEFGYTVTYWTQGGRTIVFLFSTPEIAVTELGGGNAVGLKTARLPVTLELAGPVKDARNERTGQNLGDGKEFKVDWTQNEAVVLSFAGEPPR